MQIVEINKKYMQPTTASGAIKRSNLLSSWQKICSFNFLLYGICVILSDEKQ